MPPNATSPEPLESLTGGDQHGAMNTCPESGSRSGKAAPDGGWGWLVVFGSFAVHAITDGMLISSYRMTNRLPA